MISRVLVVEDNQVLRGILLAHLNAFEVNCYGVESAEEAIDLAEFVDLILMDVHLPGISGIEATRQIRRNEHEKGLHRVAIVATTCSDKRGECLAAGMDDYCQKPITRPDLEA